ncbi:BC1872 family protein [Evansella cellulosilytica]|uniref:Phage ABA sandwich domain-containing protein n=1 Tax=Evansella cellulosilytica (strain ATCC 21833 / DSM 2522 / FERM P-1141 / JCM 9156 / N-4) TaxID=649639 RepID=E6TXM9_EVAC2|nr:hypothetical protein [Evansella cellulosilytica]ADU28843.1 hypothetical protein Bcell_0561 [Evansella cellulosilytica DSM 2522]
MDKIDVIARRILGWKQNSLHKWYNHEEGLFIENFNPYENMEHAMLIVSRLERFGFHYTKQSETEACFSNAYVKECSSGDTLALAITNAAYSLAEVNTISSEWL